MAVVTSTSAKTKAASAAKKAEPAVVQTPAVELQEEVQNNIPPVRNQPDLGMGRYDSSATPPTIHSLFGQFPTPSRLSADGEHYLDNIKATLAKVPSGATLKTIQVSIADIDAAVVYDESQKIGVCLLFAESFLNMNDAPTDRLGAVMKEFHTLRAREYATKKQAAPTSEIKLISSIVVIPEEYTSNFAMRMSHSIINTVIGNRVSNDNMFTIESLKGAEIMVCTNQSMVREYMSQCSPHMVPERSDLGFLVRIGSRDARGTLIPGDVLFGVSGYTKFITPHDVRNNQLIVPVPTITSIASHAPVVGYIPFAITLATDCFCANGMWREPYRNFATDRPNLGTLVDAYKKPVQTAQELDALINQYFAEPVLAIDISEGRYSLPGMAAFATDIVSSFIKFERFFGHEGDYADISKDKLSGIANSCVNVKYAYNTYNGIVIDKIGPQDTRCVDFMSLAITFDDDHSAISNFKVQSTNPSDRINDIRNHYTNTRILYNTRTLVFSPAFARYLIKDRFQPAKLKIHNDYTDIMGNYIYSNQVMAEKVDWQSSDFSLNQQGAFNNLRNNPNGLYQ